jgi:hypothetical protein
MRSVSNPSPDKGAPYYSEISNHLSFFDRITLAQMDSVMLFDRVDTKFLFHVRELPAIIEAMKEDYFTLEVKDTRIHTYHSLYYDTPDFVHYLRHHNQMKSRYKFRHRIYVESDLHFFEIKEKTNKSRTLKSRILKKEKHTGITDSVEELVANNTRYSAKDLHPVLWVNFHRITMVHKERQERLTIDMNLIFERDGKILSADNAAIIELKQEKMNYGIPFMKLLISKGIRPTSMSKYTMGIVNLIETQKNNLFLPKLRTINKISKSNDSTNY